MDDGEAHVITFNYVATDGSVIFFFNDTATTEIYTLSLHDALPISSASGTENDALISGNVPAASDVDGEAVTYHLVAGSVLIDGVAAPDIAMTHDCTPSYI